MIALELPIKTERLVIDHITAADAPALVDYRNDAETARFQSWPLPYDLESAEALAVSGQLGLYSGLELVGDAMVAPFATSEHEAEIGITLAPRWRGRGLAAEGITALVDAVFRQGRVKVAACVDVRNERSLRLFDSLGFRREGVICQSFQGRDGLIDEVLFGLTNTLWRHSDDELVADFDPHPADVAFLSERLYEHNSALLGIHDGAEIALFERDDLGRIVGGATGVVWAGGAELRDLWVHEDRRGAGLGRRLLAAFEEAARSRGARKVFVGTHDFQAPGFYPRYGYEITGRWDGWPEGHALIFLAKEL